MDREIKFRGYDTSNHSWVYGSLIKYKDGDCYIVEHTDYEFPFKVNPDSVGQFTGLKDRNGVEIYEGDIILSDFNSTWETVYIHSAFMIKTVLNGDLIYDYLSVNDDTITSYCYSWLEVIGNIYENPELVKTKNQ